VEGWAARALATVRKRGRPAPKVAKRAGVALLPVDRLIAEARASYGDTPLRQLRFSSGGASWRSI